MYRLERALIDTGEATPPRKQAAPYTSWCRLLLGSPGLKFFNIQFIIIFIITLISIISFKILYSRVSEALDFYRVYSTMQSIRSYHTSYQGNIKEWKYQSYLMHLGIKQFL